MERIKRIGLLAGGGELPVVFAGEAKKIGTRVIAFAAKGIASPELEKHVDKAYWIDLSEIGRLPLLFFINGIRKLVMLGKIPKNVVLNRDFSKSRAMQSLLTHTQNRSDDTILRDASRRIERFGVKFISPSVFLSALMPGKGNLAKRGPTAAEWEDIEFGIQTAKAVGSLDIGQTVVVKNKAVLAVEAIEGTDETIKRAGAYCPEGAVVAKVMKPGQDPRFDIPAIGLKTIDLMIDINASVLAVEAGRTLFVNMAEAVEKADRHDISIVAV